MVGHGGHATIYAQPSATEGVVIRSTTRLVEINVIAQNRAGRYLPDLRREDFTVLDNGRPQTISVFAANTAPGTSPAPAPAPNTFTNQMDGHSGFAVILLDWLNTGFGDRAQSRRQVLDMLRRIDTPDHIAIYVLGRDLRVVHEFGGDTAALLRAIGRASGVPDAGPHSGSPYDASHRDISTDLFGPPPAAAPPGSRITVEEQVMRLDTRIRDTLSALEAIGRNLEGVQGRKSLIWLSAGIPTSIDGNVIRGARPGERTYTDEIERALRKLINAGVAVYPIDARGLSVSPKAYINIATMEQFAHRTGGKAYANRNDIGDALRSALDDQRISYTLGFYPSGDSTSDAPHHLRVKVDRPGVTLRYRGEYFAAEAPQAPGEILSSPLDATALPIALRIRRKPGSLDVTIVLDPTTLSLVEQNRRWHGRIEIVPRFLDSGGAFVGSAGDQAVQLDMLPETYQTGLREGLGFQLPLAIPAAAQRLRILVRDDGSRRTGTLTVPLDQVR